MSNERELKRQLENVSVKDYENDNTPIAPVPTRPVRRVGKPFRPIVEEMAHMPQDLHDDISPLKEYWDSLGDSFAQRGLHVEQLGSHTVRQNIPPRPQNEYVDYAFARLPRDLVREALRAGISAEELQTAAAREKQREDEASRRDAEDVMAQAAQAINIRRLRDEDTRRLREAQQRTKRADEEKKKIAKNLDSATAQEAAAPLEAPRKAGSKCIVCFEKDVNQLMMPCMHVATCEGCAAKILSGKAPACPVCRATIVSLSTIYLCSAEDDDDAT